MINSIKWLDRVTLASLCAMIFILPFSKSMVEMCIIVSIVSWFLKRSKPASTKISFLIYLFLLAGALSIVTSASISLSLRGFFSKLLKGALLFFVIAETVNEKKKLNLILISMLLSAVIVGIDGIWQLMSGWDFIRHYNIVLGRIRACFGNANSLAGWLTIMLPLVLSIIVTGKDQRHKVILKSMALVLICVLILCLVMTYSRGGWLGVILASIFIGIFKKNKSLFIVIPVMIALSFIISPSIKDRLTSIVSFNEPIRNNLWREAIAIIKVHPMFGCGLNTYSIVAPHYRVNIIGGIYPHNSYLQMTAEMGFVGLTAFLCLILTLFITSLNNMMNIKDKSSKAILLGLIAGLLGFLAQSFFDVNFYTVQLSNLMWFTMGLIIAVQNIGLKEERA